MPKDITFSFINFVGSCLVSFVLCLLFLQYLPNGFVYHDIVAGPSSMAGEGKSLDYKLFYLFIVFFVLVYVGFNWQKPDPQKMLYAFLPLSWAIARLVTGQFNPKHWIFAALTVIISLAWDTLKKLPLWLLQIPLPLLWLDLLPHISGIKTKPVLMALLLVLMIVGWWNIWRQKIAPLAILPLLVFMVTPIAGLTQLPTDDYHFGEIILPWQQWFDFGIRPYVDYNHIHGLLHFCQGALNYIFYGPDLTTYQYAAKLHMSLSISLFFLAISRLLGLWPALLISITACFINMHTPNYWGENYAIIMVPAIIALLADPEHWRHPLRWLVIFCVCATTMIFYRTTHGIALTIAGLPFAVLTLRKINWHDRTTYIVIAVMLFAASFLILFTPAGEILSGLVRYVSINNRVNDEAWGESWAQAIQHKEADSAFIVGGVFIPGAIWQFLRMGWIVLMLLAGGVFALTLQQNKQKNPSLMLFSGMLMIYLFVLHPYSLGRLSNQNWQISGKLSIVMITTALPIMLALLFSKRGPQFWLIIGLVAALYQSAFSPLLPGLEKIYWQSKIPHASHSEFHWVGSAAIKPEHATNLRQLNAILNTYLKPGELFWDIYGHNAVFSYLHRPVPFKENGFYNIVGEQAEEEIIHGLETKNIVLISAQQPLVQYAPISLRQPRIYAYIMKHYTPRLIDGHWFLVKNERADAFSAITENDKEQALLRIFGGDDLKGTPIAWGHSFHRLEKYFSFEESNHNTKEWLLLKVECQKPTEGHITSGGQFWQSLKIESGDLLVPLSANSNWYGKKGMQKLGFEAEGCKVLKSQRGMLKPYHG